MSSIGLSVLVNNCVNSEIFPVWLTALEVVSLQMYVILIGICFLFDGKFFDLCCITYNLP